MTTGKEEQTSKFDAKFWITMLRAFLAVILGTALLFQPEKARPFLVNFMGMFWLAGGLVSLRWGASGGRARKWSIAVGIIGVVAGLVTVARRVMTGYMPEMVVAYVLGVVMILTGIMHLVSGLRNKSAGDKRPWAGMLLGVFEIVLGSMLLISPLSYGPVVYWAITLWAFLGGFILFREAWRQRKQPKDATPAKKEPVPEIEEVTPAVDIAGSEM